MNVSIISKQTAGILMIGGLLAISFFSLIAMPPFHQALVLLLGLMLAIFFLYQPKWGLLAIIVFRPSIDRFSENINLNLLRDFSINAAAIFGMLVIFLMSFFIFHNKKFFGEVPLKKIWLLFLLVCAVSFFFSIDISASFYEFVRVVSIFLVFISFYIISKIEKSPMLILYAIFASIAVPFLFATYQLLTKSGLGGTSGIESRLFGTFSHPNPFASFVLISLVVALFLALRSKDSGNKLFFYLAIFWGALLLLQTYSRGAWIAFLLFLLILSLVKSPKSILVIAIACLTIYISSEMIRDRIEDIYNPPVDSSVRWRFDQWKKMYAVFLESPWTGKGIGTEVIAHEQTYGYSEQAGNPYTHNDYLRIALETGIPGFIIYIFIMLTALKLLIKKYREEKELNRKDYHLFILALFIAMISFSLSNNTLRETVTQWTLWGLIGTSLALSKKDPK